MSRILSVNAAPVPPPFVPPDHSRFLYAFVATEELGKSVWNIAKTAIYSVGTLFTLCQNETWNQQAISCLKEAGESLVTSMLATVGTLSPETINRWLFY